MSEGKKGEGEDSKERDKERAKEARWVNGQFHSRTAHSSKTKGHKIRWTCVEDALTKRRVIKKKYIPGQGYRAQQGDHQHGQSA